MIRSETLRPGLLVSLKSGTTGNVTYTKTPIETAKNDDGSAIAKWETVRKIIDPEEHDAAGKARSKARALITSVCAGSAFGLLCPESKADDLDNAVKAARAVAEEFNATAKLSRVHVYVITGRIASDDVEAVKAINSEVRELMDDMQQGIANFDVKRIRDAASRVKDMGQMLSPDAEARVQIAVQAAREAAKKIVAAGETAAKVVDQATITKITEMRTAFIDLGEAGAIAAPAETGLALDLEPQAERARAQDGYQPEARELEIAPTPGCPDLIDGKTYRVRMTRLSGEDRVGTWQELPLQVQRSRKNNEVVGVSVKGADFAEFDPRSDWQETPRRALVVDDYMLEIEVA